MFHGRNRNCTMNYCICACLAGLSELAIKPNFVWEVTKSIHSEAGNEYETSKTANSILVRMQLYCAPCLRVKY